MKIVQYLCHMLIMNILNSFEFNNNVVIAYEVVVEFHVKNSAFVLYCQFLLSFEKNVGNFLLTRGIFIFFPFIRGWSSRNSPTSRLYLSLLTSFTTSSGLSHVVVTLPFEGFKIVIFMISL